MDGVRAGVTVVLPTFRRFEALRRAIDGLATQDDPGVPWEVVVVDNDDPPGAKVAFGEAAAGFPVPIRLTHAPERGACHARNWGLREVTTPLVAFLDDDVAPRSDWLRTLLGPILAGRSTGAAGKVVLDWQQARPRWLSSSLDGYLAAFAPGADERQLEPDEFLLTANAAFDAELLRATGGFDPALGPRDGVPLVNDDVDIFRRYLGVGGSVRYVPAALVVHELPGSRLRPTYLVRRVYAQGRSDWLLDRDEYMSRRFRGVAVAWWRLRHDLGQRRDEGLLHTAVAYRLLTDVARAGGFWREAVSSATRRRG